MIDGSIDQTGGPNTGRFVPGSTTTAQTTTNNSDANSEHFDLTTVSNAGTTLNLAEQLQDGHTKGSVQCTSGDNTQSGVNPGAVSLTVQKGQTWTCVFTNTVNEGSVSVIKKVDGVVTAAWTIHGSVPGAGSGRFTGGATATQGNTTADELAPLTFGLEDVANAGTPVTLTEDVKDGYSFGDVTCMNGGTPVPVTRGELSGTVTVQTNQHIVCTFNNTVNKAKVTVRKTIDGGAPVAGWQFAAAVTPPASVDSSPKSTAGSPAQALFNLTKVSNSGSTVTLTETLQGGYSFDAATCLDGDSKITVTPGNLSAAFTVNTGDDIVCTFNNTVNKAKVTVRKTVDGGDPVAGWTFDASTMSPAVLDVPQGTTVAGSPAGFTFNLSTVSNEGSSTTLTEQLLDGYSFDDVTCLDGAAPVGMQKQGLGVTVKVHKGDDIVCTFNNTVNKAKVTVRKTIDGGAPVAGWQFAATVTPPASVDSSPKSTAGSPAQALFNLTKVSNSGSTVTLTETLQGGYSFDAATCLDGDSKITVTPGNLSAAFTVNTGDDIVCTFNNTTNTGTIKVVKKVGGTQVADWTINATNPAGPATITSRFGGHEGRFDGGLRPEQGSHGGFDDDAERGESGWVHGWERDLHRTVRGAERHGRFGERDGEAGRDVDLHVQQHAEHRVHHGGQAHRCLGHDRHRRLGHRGFGAGATRPAASPARMRPTADSTPPERRRVRTHR